MAQAIPAVGRGRAANGHIESPYFQTITVVDTDRQRGRVEPIAGNTQNSSFGVDSQLVCVVPLMAPIEQ